MREAAAKAMEMASGRERADLSSNEMLAMALTRCLEILGEAAAKISPEARVRFRLVPFAKMIVMRNHLIHAYFDIKLGYYSSRQNSGVRIQNGPRIGLQQLADLFKQLA
jgi:uncharacterized protein with HEPN domain